jgi:DNA/RNA endonuclease YhcR with UshA esterase domain
VRLVVDDGSGAVTVVIWADVAGESERPGSFVRGGRVDVQGRVVEYRGQLEVLPELASDVLELVPAGEGATQLRLSELGAERAGDTVTVTAQIVYSVPCSSGVRFGLRQGNAEGYLLGWSGWLDACPAAAQLLPGAMVTARGLVTLYEGKPEIVPQRPDDVVVTGMSALPSVVEGIPTLPAPQAGPTDTTRRVEPTRSIATPAVQQPPRPDVAETGTLSPEAAGSYVTVQGSLVDVVLFASGQRCAVDDGSGALAMWLPSERFVGLYSREDWRYGCIVRVRGQVELYKGEVELVPDGPEDVWIVTPARTETESLTRLADLRESHVGKRLTVEGKVVEVRPFSQGIKYLLDDGSGRLTVLLWQSVLDDLPVRDCLALDGLVRATGKVSAYQGALELAPGVGRDVRCIP